MVKARELIGLSYRAAVKAVCEQLELANCPDAEFDARQLVEMACGTGRWNEDLTVNEAQAEKLALLCNKRCERRPLQYLAGSWAFLDLELEVGPGVLIPRSDTETVCENAAELIKDLDHPRVLDLCSGSGCLALGICRFVKGAQVTALEKSREAWPYLCRNAETLKRERGYSVEPVQGDVFGFENEIDNAVLDLIVSNPPYLTAEEMNELQPEVRFEPSMALDGGKDGLMFYRHIVNAYADKLKPGGWMVFEIGWQQSEAVEGLMRAAGFDKIETRPDWEGRPRTVLGQRPI